MKILVTTDLFPTPSNPNRGIFIFQWAKHLAQKVDLTILQAVWIPREATISAETLENFGTHFEVPPRRDNEFTWYQIPLKMPRYDRLWRRGLIFGAAAEKYLQGRLTGFDLFVGQMGIPGGFVAVKLGKKYNKKSLVGLRGSDVTSYLYKPVLKNFAFWTYRRADAIVTVSQALRQQLIELKIPATRISVIYNGINPIFQPMEQKVAREYLHLPEGNIILFVGNLIRIKDWHTLIEGLKILFQTTVGKCYLIGDGEDRVLIEKKIKQENLNDKIILVGNVPHTALLYWYNAADVLCLPSLREGIPNVILEAFACGRPVVASDIIGNREIVREGVNGFLHRMGDSQSLAEALKKALDTDWNTTSICSTVRDFTWVQNTNHYLDILKKMSSKSLDLP